MAKNGRSKLRAIHCLVSIPADTDYFAPSTKPFVINLQVENLDEVLAQLKREGVDVDLGLKAATTANSPGSWIRKETELNFGSQRRIKRR